MRKRNVGCVGAATGDQRAVFEARNRFSDEGHTLSRPTWRARAFSHSRLASASRGKNSVGGKASPGSAGGEAALRLPRRQRQWGDVGRNPEFLGAVPAGFIENENGVGA